MANRTSVYAMNRRRLLGAGAASVTTALAMNSRVYAAGDQSAIPQPEAARPDLFIDRAFAMRDRATEAGDQGYGAIIVNSSGRIVGQAPSRVVTNADPTAHAEMEAIRDAARRSGSRDLSGHVMYSSSRPCPMCEAAAYWAGVATMVYGRDGTDGGKPRLCR